MLALSAGFRHPSRSRRALRDDDVPRRAARPIRRRVMGIITGEMFIAFSMVLVMLAMSALAPLRTWRAAMGVAAAPSWKLALGLWTAGFGASLFLLTCIFGGALLRASDVLGASGNWLEGLWIFFTWRLLRPSAHRRRPRSPPRSYSVLALRLATRPGLLMGATFRRLHRLGSPCSAWGLAGLIDVNGQGFAIKQLFPQAHALDLGMGFIFASHKKAAVHARDVADLIGTAGGAPLPSATCRAGGHGDARGLWLYRDRASRRLWCAAGIRGRVLAGFASRIGARFGLSGVIVDRYGARRSGRSSLLAAAVARGDAQGGRTGFRRRARFRLGALYMLRWPELCEAFEQGGPAQPGAAERDGPHGRSACFWRSTSPCR